MRKTSTGYLQDCPIIELNFKPITSILSSSIVLGSFGTVHRGPIYRNDLCHIVISIPAILIFITISVAVILITVYIIPYPMWAP